MSDLIVNDTLLRYPAEILGIFQVSANDWVELNKKEQRIYYENRNIIGIPYFPIETINYFREHSQTIINSAGPFAIPKNIPALDSNGVFYGQKFESWRLRFSF